MRTLVIGDIHGGYRALVQVLERARFDYNQDRLVALGDIVDGWPQSREVIDELLKIKHLVLILGNHDEWFLQWVEHGCRLEWADQAWINQGGLATLVSYSYSQVPHEHYTLFKRAKLVWQDEAGRVYCHGGINTDLPLSLQKADFVLWDRSFLHTAYKRSLGNPDYRLTKYPEVYVGHTTTTNYKSAVPVHFCEVWDMDTGGGWEGRLSVMDVDTKELFQSDTLATLYPDTEHAKQLENSPYGPRAGYRSRLFKKDDGGSACSR